MSVSTLIESVSERKIVHPDTIRGYARQISKQCVKIKAIHQLNEEFSPSNKQMLSKKARRKIIQKISARMKAAVCVHKVNPQACHAVWLVLVSDGEGGIDIMRASLSLRPTKQIEFSTILIATFSKHSVERLVERWRIRNLCQLVATIEPTFGWLHQAVSLLPPNGNLLPLPLPDGLLCVRKNFGGVPTIVTAIDRASFTRDSELQWQGLSDDSEFFDHQPDIFKDPGNLSIKNLSKFIQLGACGMASDVLKELRRIGAC